MWCAGAVVWLVLAMLCLPLVALFFIAAYARVYWSSGLSNGHFLTHIQLSNQGQKLFDGVDGLLHFTLGNIGR